MSRDFKELERRIELLFNLYNTQYEVFVTMQNEVERAFKNEQDFEAIREQGTEETIIINIKAIE